MLHLFKYIWIKKMCNTIECVRLEWKREKITLMTISSRVTNSFWMTGSLVILKFFFHDTSSSFFFQFFQVITLYTRRESFREPVKNTSGIAFTCGKKREILHDWQTLKILLPSVFSFFPHDFFFSLPISAWHMALLPCFRVCNCHSIHDE